MWVVEVGLPVLVLQPHPLRVDRWSGLPAHLGGGQAKFFLHQNPMI